MCRAWVHSCKLRYSHDWLACPVRYILRQDRIVECYSRYAGVSVFREDRINSSVSSELRWALSSFKFANRIMHVIVGRRPRQQEEWPMVRNCLYMYYALKHIIFILGAKSYGFVWLCGMGRLHEVCTNPATKGDSRHVLVNNLPWLVFACPTEQNLTLQ